MALQAQDHAKKRSAVLFIGSDEGRRVGRPRFLKYQPGAQLQDARIVGRGGLAEAAVGEVPIHAG